jgi:Protein  of unknown function (DUF3018)
MSDTERVRAWRQRLKDHGLVPMTIWVPADTKARYEDLALQSHRSVSELAQHALAAYRLDPSLVSAPITDTEQLQGLIRDEIDQAIAIVTATVTATVTDAVTTALPAMIETALQPYVSATVSDTETATPQVPPITATAETPVADTATVPAMEAGAGVPPRAREERSVADTGTDTATDTLSPRGGRFKLTPAQEAELRAKKAAGTPIKALMEEYGLSKATVHRYLSAPPGA